MRPNWIAAACGFVISVALGLAVSASASQPCIPTSVLFVEHTSYAIDGVQTQAPEAHPPLESISSSGRGAWVDRTEPRGLRSIALIEEAGE